MDKQLLHTPEGVRDIYGEELKRKHFIENQLINQLHLYGYEDISTPTFEFFDVFSKKIGTIPSKELYKFIDKEGNTLVLRPDITPSIARADAKYFMEDNMPRRFCYSGNTFINSLNLQGRLKETTQIGAELLSDDSINADAEMIALIIDCMRTSGLEEFQVSVGNLEFFKGLCDEYGIPSEIELELRGMISSKNYFGILDILNSLSLSEDKKNAVLNISEIYGSMDTISSFKNIVNNERSLKAIERLEEINKILTKMGISKYVNFDLGMLSKYHYYTGVIFRAYTYGSGDAVIKGGRYDDLLTEFGKKSPAIGFAIVVDKLLCAIDSQGLNPVIGSNSSLVLYEDENYYSALDCAKELRAKGRFTVMLKKSPDMSVDDYKEYAKNNNYELILK